MSHMSVEPDTLNGPREWGRAIEGPRPDPARYGQTQGIPLSTARRLIADYEQRQADWINGMPEHNPDHVLLIICPDFDSQSPTRPYGWYWTAPPEPQWQHGDVVAAACLGMVRTAIFDGDHFRTPSGDVMYPCDDCQLTLLVRDGRPVQ